MSDKITSHGWVSRITVDIIDSLGIGHNEVNSELEIDPDSTRLDNIGSEKPTYNEEYVMETMGLDASEIEVYEITFEWNEVSSKYSGNKRGNLYIEASQPNNYIIVFSDGEKVENL